MLRRGLIASNAAGGSAVTWNPADMGSGLTLSGSNLILTMTSSSVYRAARATLGRSTGKYYFEIVAANDTEALYGIADAGATLTNYIGSTTLAYGYYQNNGDKWNNSVGASFGANLAVGNIVGVAVDLTAGKLWFAKNNTWQASGNPVAGTNAAYTGLTGTKYPAMNLYFNGSSATGRFKASDFSYSPPSGFSAWE